jgi:NAD(P)-dependent dehydrogenase (short-subunit alcohol dehydrogenase family)
MGSELAVRIDDGVVVVCVRGAAGAEVLQRVREGIDSLCGSDDAPPVVIDLTDVVMTDPDEIRAFVAAVAEWDVCFVSPRITARRLIRRLCSGPLPATYRSVDDAVLARRELGTVW